MSFWKNLFGGGGGNADQKSAEPGVAGEENYKGYLVKALIMPAGSELQLPGLIEKTVDGEPKSYKFVRADRFSSRDDMVGFALAKGRQIIDEQGDGIYR